MPIADFQYTEGTIKNPQHTKSSEACFIETNLLHFPDGFATNIPNFIPTDINLIRGVIQGQCRSQWATRKAGGVTVAGAYFYYGTHSHLYVTYKGRTHNITPLKTVAELTLDADPLSVDDDSNIMTVSYPAHGLAVGDRIKLAGAIDVGGVLAGAINKEHIVVDTPGDDSFTIAVTTATSTATGGGAAVEVFKQIAAGVAFQDLASGWGYGDPDGWGAGIFGLGGFSDGEQVYPRIWSIDNFGNDVIFCPDDYIAGDGQKIYIWDGDFDVAPTVLANAPTNCNWVSVVNNTIIALCGNAIRTSELGNGVVWTGLTTTTIPVQRVTRLLSLFGVGEKAAVIFAPTPYLLRFVGGEWDLIELGIEYPVAAPMAACKLGDGLIWYSEDGNFYYFDGGSIRTIVNRQNGEYIRQVINRNAIWTIFMMADQKHNQAWLFYPTGENKNPNEYVIMNPRTYAKKQNPEPSFTLGNLNRTSAQRPAIVDTEFYMMNGSAVFQHYVQGAATFAWGGKTAFFYFDGQQRYKMTRFIPDMYREGVITLKVKGQETPLGREIDYGEYGITSAMSYQTIRAAGKMFSFEFAANTDATIITGQIDVVPMGGGLM